MWDLNLTKCCACHKKWLLCLILVTYETSFPMRGATGVTIQPHQILRLPRKMTLQDFRENPQKQVKRHFQCGDDPSMIRPWSDHKNANRNPPRNRGYFSSSPRAFSIEKYNVSRPILHSNLHQILRQPRKVTLALHEVLRLPRKVTLALHEVLRLPRKVTLELHQVLHLPRKVTLALHQILRLPRKMTPMLDPRYIWNLISNARSNRCHYPTSPNTAPATKNDTARFQRKSPKTGETSFPMRGRSEHDPTMIRPWKRKPQPASPPRLLFELTTSIFYWKIQRFAPNLTFKPSPNTAPATKSDTSTSRSTAPATKSDTWTSPSTAPATKSDTWTSPNTAPDTKSDTSTSRSTAPATKSDTWPSPSVTVLYSTLLNSMLYSTLLNSTVLYCNCTVTELDCTLLCSTLLYLTLLYLTLLYLTLLYLTLLYLTLLYLTLLYLTLLYLTLLYLTLLYLTLLYLTLLYLTLLYLTLLYLTLLYLTLLYLTLLYLTLLYLTLLYLTLLYLTLLYLTLLYLTLLYLTILYLTLLYLTLLYLTLLYLTLLYLTLLYLTLLYLTLLYLTLLYLTLLYLTLLYLTLLGCRSYIGSFSSKLPLIIHKEYLRLYTWWTSEDTIDFPCAFSGWPLSETFFLAKQRSSEVLAAYRWSAPSSHQSHQSCVQLLQYAFLCMAGVSKLILPI